MDSSSIELNGAEITSIDHNGDQVVIHFSRASLIKTMTGSAERTRWWQAGSLIIDGATLAAPLPVGPLICTGGDLDANIYTYRDMIPLPFASRGYIRCVLHFADNPARLEINGQAAQLVMHDLPKYIEHLRPA